MFKIPAGVNPGDPVGVVLAVALQGGPGQLGFPVVQAKFEAVDDLTVTVRTLDKSVLGPPGLVVIRNELINALNFTSAIALPDR